MQAVVIGAGPVGLATAHGLIESGADVTVLEAGPRDRRQGSGLTLFGNGVAALAWLGLGESMERLTGGLAPTEGGLRSPRGDWLSRTPQSALLQMRVVHREELHAALLGELPPGTVRFETSAEVTSAEDGVVTIGRDETVRADLVVVADGIRSRSRRQVTQDPGTRHAGYGTWRGVTRDPVPGVIASETWGAGLRFGIVPLADGRVYWFGVSRTDPTSSGDPRSEVLERFAGWHEPIADLVKGTDADVVSWLPIEELARPLATYVRGRTVLVGDAAHAMTPNLGQGANQGLVDAATLCALLRAKDLPTALARYDALRRPAAAKVARQSRQVGAIAQAGNPLLVRIRDAVLRALPDSSAGAQFRPFATWQAP